MAQQNIVLFYPRLGWMDTFILDLPLSLVYVGDTCRKNGIEIRMFDQRVEGKTWKDKFLKLVDDDTILVGFSCMTGSPITHALEATRLVKTHSPEITTVWGGYHPTICYESTMREPTIDYIVRGHGHDALHQLVQYLNKGGDLSAVEGLGWIDKAGELQLNPMPSKLSFPLLKDLSFEGIEMSNYTRFNYQQRVYSLFTSFGCPHKCGFCFAPIHYKNYKKRWYAYEPDAIIDHIEMAVEKFGAQYISILDEEFLIQRKRAESIFQKSLDRGLDVEWGIRGIRVDDLYRADDSFLELLKAVGVKQVMIGVESGSPRMLKLMQKGITVEQTISVNQRLAKNKIIIPSYNFMSGLPGETVEDLYQSVDLILQLLDDNPDASFSGMNQFQPYPGSDLYDLCVKAGFKEPKDLEGWAYSDTHFSAGETTAWLDKKVQNTLNAIQVSLMFSDNKVARELGATGIGKSKQGNSKKGTRGRTLGLVFKMIPVLAGIYQPVARWRLRHHFFSFLIEYKLYSFLSRRLGRIFSLPSQEKQSFI